MSKVSVYYGEKVVGRVTYNNNLDTWNGHDWNNGSTGRLVNDETALQAILRSGKEDLLEKYFPDHNANLEEV